MLNWAIRVEGAELKAAFDLLFDQDKLYSFCEKNDARKKTQQTYTPIKDYTRYNLALLNPLKPGSKTQCKTDIMEYRALTVEHDNLSIEEQIGLLKSKNIPATVVVYSGKKSVHAHIVFREALTIEQRAVAVEKILLVFPGADPAPLKNPTQPTRLPGAKRGGEVQSLLAIGERIDFDVFCAWCDEHADRNAVARQQAERKQAQENARRQINTGDIGEGFKRAVIETLLQTPGVCPDRETWFKLLLALKAGGISYDIADKIFSQSENYNEPENRRKWESEEPEPGGITFQSAYFIAEQANKPLLRSLLAKYPDNRGLRAEQLLNPVATTTTTTTTTETTSPGDNTTTESPGDWFDRLLEKERIYINNPGKLFGFALDKSFEPVQDRIEGIQPGLYIVGAATNVGKTAFIANLANSLLDSNENLKVIYFSLDDPKTTIAGRIRAIRAFDDADENKISKVNSLEINDFRKPLRDDFLNEKREKINSQFRELLESRLYIYDVSDTSSLSEIEKKIKAIDGEKVVFLDGVYNCQIGVNANNKREEVIAIANTIKDIASKLDIAIICTAEIRKKPVRSNQSNSVSLDDLMESGKFGYNANLIWLLEPYEGKQKKQKSNNSEEEQGYVGPGECAVLRLKYAKNKFTAYKGQQYIKYYTKHAKMFVYPYQDGPQTW